MSSAQLLHSALLIVGSSFLITAGCGGGSNDTFAPELTLNNAPTVSGVVPKASEDQPFSFTPQVTDADGDRLVVTVGNLPAWLRFNPSSYEVAGTPGESALGQSQEIRYSVSDGTESVDFRFRVQVDYDNMKQALRTGDYRYVDDANAFIDRAHKAVTDSQSDIAALKTALFNLETNGDVKADGSSLDAIDWVPSHDAAQLLSSFGRNHEVLISNATSDPNYDVHPRALGIAGQRAGDARNAKFVALGGNPLRNSYRDPSAVNEQMHNFVERSIEWLAGRDDFSTTPLKVVTAQMSQSYYFPDQVATAEWLEARYPSQVAYNTPASCDGSALAACLSDDVDLLLISQVSFNAAEDSATMSAVRSWLAAGKPIFYMHHDGNLTDLGRTLLPALNVKYQRDNYWWRLSFAGYNGAEAAGGVPDNVALITSLLQRLRDQTFAINLAACSDKSCPDDSGFAEQFLTGAEASQDLFEDFDKNGLRLFDERGNVFYKTLILLADKYRQGVGYPMDKTNTPQIDFLKSYFADHNLYNQRDINPAQPDMGNFSRSDFSHITPTNKTVVLTSKRHFRSAGVYAIPGQTLRVTRTDNAAVNTSVFINTIRSGATHQFNDNAYSRPKFLRSVAMPIAPGETLEITSAHGGTLQLGFDSNDQHVSFQFENIGQHPHWSGRADDQAFEAALEAGEFDWAEVVTSGFEVHSKLDKMRTSVSSDQWNNAAALASATQRYMSNFPHVLAGFQGPGIDVIDEIHDFAAAKNWSIDTIDLVKHMNADQATCGYGCSGNPYDAYWSYGPTAHGDLHELGHGLETGKFRFAGWAGHASTNPYSYYSKSQYYKDTAQVPNCQSLPFASLKQTLQDSRSQPDPFAYMQAAELTGWSQGVAIYIQMMMAAQEQGALVDGWHLLARLHVLHREFNRADNADDSWLAARDNLGFAQFTREEARGLNNNDWLSVAISTVLERDMRSFLAMWGLDVGASAAAQIASLGYAALPTKFYDSSTKGYCETMSPTAININ